MDTPEGCDVSNRFLDSVMPSAAAVAASALGPISSSAVVAGLNKGLLNSMMPSAAVVAGLNDIADAVRSAALTTEPGNSVAEVIQSFADAAERFPVDVERCLASVVEDEDVKEVLSGADTSGRDVSEGIALFVLLMLLTAVSSAVRVERPDILKVIVEILALPLGIVGVISIFLSYYGNPPRR